MPAYIPETPQSLADLKYLTGRIVYFSYQALQEPPVFRDPTTSLSDVRVTVLNIRGAMYDFIDSLVLSSNSSLFGKNDLIVWAQTQAAQLLNSKANSKLNYVLYAKYIESDKFLSPLITPVNAPYDTSFTKVIDTVGAATDNFPAAVESALRASGVLPF